jgi:2,5-diketo-D-gluconate reductase A
MRAAQIATPLVRLHDGVEIPQLGLTLFQVPPEETRGVVEQALAAGYRHFDTAAAHGNEREAGEALARCRLPREDYFVSSKLSILQADPQATLDAFEASLERLGLDHVDLCLVNGSGASPEQLLAAWRALEWIQREEAARTIGVANFGAAELALVERQSRSWPTVNQVELNPRLQQPELCALHAARGIATEAWGPLGQEELLVDPAIMRLACAGSSSSATSPLPGLARRPAFARASISSTSSFLSVSWRRSPTSAATARCCSGNLYAFCSSFSPRLPLH